jgi:hypothetical protein
MISQFLWGTQGDFYSLFTEHRTLHLFSQFLWGSKGGFPKDLFTDHGTSHMLSEFLWSPNRIFFWQHGGEVLVFKLPHSYATELALSIGHKKALNSLAKVISWLKVWGWWNWTCFLNSWLLNLCIYGSITVGSISEYLKDGIHTCCASIRRLCPYYAAVSDFGRFIFQNSQRNATSFSRRYIYMLFGHLFSV